MTKNYPLKVLIAVPEWKTRLSIESAMKEARVAVAIASNSDEAVRVALTKRPEIIVMDRKIPPMGAIRLCMKLRSDAGLSASRIIVLGDSEESAGEQAAMAAGADAYLSKQLDAKTLLKNIVGIQRRRPTPSDPEVLKAGAIEMVLDQWMVSVNANPVHLTEIEYRLLQELLQVKGRVLTRETLMERVWGHSKPAKLQTRTLDVHMSRLRNKLHTASKSIITVRNVGYRIDVFPDWLSH